MVSCLAMVPWMPYLVFDICTNNIAENISHSAFEDLKKAFNRVPKKVISWVMWKLGIKEWKVKFVQAKYANAASGVCINNTFSEKFDIKVEVLSHQAFTQHEGSVLSPLLFVVVIKALSQVCQRGCPRELLYADDLVIMDESLDGLLNQFPVWKDSSDARRL